MGGINAATGTRLQAAREAMGMSQMDMARALQSERLLIKAVERGYAQPGDDMITGLRQNFGINEAFLRGEDVPMFVEKNASSAVTEETKGNCDLVLTLAHCALDMGRSLTEGEGLIPHDATQERVTAEEEFRKCVEAYAGDDLTMMNAIIEKAWLMQGTTEIERFEEGMRYGARLVFNLLAGKRGLLAL